MSNQRVRAHVAVYGGSFIDTKWRAIDKIYEGSSAAAKKSEHFGGVARNIAESLSWLNVPCGLVSRVGDDSHGKQIIQHLKLLNINTDDIYSSSRLPTANYTAFFHNTGELFAALTDLRLYQRHDKTWLTRAIERNQRASVHLLDTDLTIEESTLIAELAEGAVWVTATCLPAAAKIYPLLDKVDALFLNWRELEVLSGNLPLKAATEAMLKRGVGFVVVTLGSDGAYFASKALCFHLPAVKTAILDVTGAGDALAAGFLAAFLHEKPFPQCLEFGLKCASLALQTEEAVSPKLRDIAYLLETIDC
ncbi:MAG TPA: PfkB family carbohydrate kinase [Myxococcota bacterium]|nr:PfkB family carbohydrate kinase [Myxococcota bacterium]